MDNQSKTPEWALLVPIVVVIPTVVTGDVIAGITAAVFFATGYAALARCRLRRADRRTKQRSTAA